MEAPAPGWTRTTGGRHLVLHHLDPSHPHPFLALWNQWGLGDAPGFHPQPHARWWGAAGGWWGGAERRATWTPAPSPGADWLVPGVPSHPGWTRPPPPPRPASNPRPPRDDPGSPTLLHATTDDPYLYDYHPSPSSAGAGWGRPWREGDGEGDGGTTIERRRREPARSAARRRWEDADEEEEEEEGVRTVEGTYGAEARGRPASVDDDVSRGPPDEGIEDEEEKEGPWRGRTRKAAWVDDVASLEVPNVPTELPAVGDGVLRYSRDALVELMGAAGTAAPTLTLPAAIRRHLSEPPVARPDGPSKDPESLLEPVPEQEPELEPVSAPVPKPAPEPVPDREPEPKPEPELERERDPEVDSRQEPAPETSREQVREVECLSAVALVAASEKTFIPHTADQMRQMGARAPLVPWRSFADPTPAVPSSNPDALAAPRVSGEDVGVDEVKALLERKKKEMQEELDNQLLAAARALAQKAAAATKATEREEPGTPRKPDDATMRGTGDDDEDQGPDVRVVEPSGSEPKSDPEARVSSGGSGVIRYTAEELKRLGHATRRGVAAGLGATGWENDISAPWIHVAVASPSVSPRVSRSGGEAVVPSAAPDSAPGAQASADKRREGEGVETATQRTTYCAAALRALNTAACRDPPPGFNSDPRWATPTAAAVDQRAERKEAKGKGKGGQRAQPPGAGTAGKKEGEAPEAKAAREAREAREEAALEAALRVDTSAWSLWGPGDPEAVGTCGAGWLDDDGMFEEPAFLADAAAAIEATRRLDADRAAAAAAAAAATRTDVESLTFAPGAVTTFSRALVEASGALRPYGAVQATLGIVFGSWSAVESAGGSSPAVWRASVGFLQPWEGEPADLVAWLTAEETEGRGEGSAGRIRPIGWLQTTPMLGPVLSEEVRAAFLAHSRDGRPGGVGEDGNRTEDDGNGPRGRPPSAAAMFVSVDVIRSALPGNAAGACLEAFDLRTGAALDYEVAGADEGVGGGEGETGRRSGDREG